MSINNNNDEVLLKRQDPKTKKAKIGLYLLGILFVLMLVFNATKPVKTPDQVLEECFKECTVQEYLATKKHLEGQVDTTESKLSEAEEVLLSGVSSGQGEIASGVVEDKTETNQQ